MNTEYSTLKEIGVYHNLIKNKLDEFIRPNIKLIDIVQFIETEIKYLGLNTINSGIAFPVGVNVNNIVAHDTCFPNDKRILKKDDIIKVDFGIHKDGYIIDSAKTFYFDNKYSNIVNASIDATHSAIKMMRPDQILGEVGTTIQEIIESYGLKSIGYLSGHQIKQYNIHGGKAVPNINFNYNERVCVDEVYAVETYPSTYGNVRLDHSMDKTSHFKLEEMNSRRLDKKTKRFYDNIYERFKTLPFGIRDIHYLPKYKYCLKQLKTNNLVQYYPTIYEPEGHYSAQTEETIYVSENSTQILS